MQQNGRITAVGRKGAVTAPAGATHMDLTGKTEPEWNGDSPTGSA